MTLTIDNVTKRYGRRTVLEDVSFTVDEGAIVGLLGPNGAGKSTALHIVSGLIKPSSGAAFTGSRRGRRRSGSEIGFCPDDLPQPDLLTAQEYLDLMQGVRGTRVKRETVLMLLRAFRLDGHLRDLVGSYSHGMKRKLQVVGALLHAPKTLILDEPFRGLDPESGAIMHHLIQAYAKRGNSVLMSTHDLALAERLCDHVVVLEQGRVIRRGPTSEVVAAQGEEDLERAFLSLTGLDAVVDESIGLFFEGLEELRQGSCTKS